MSLGNGEAVVNGADRLQTRKNDMQQQKLANLKTLLAAATPGPWESYSAPCCPDMGGIDAGGRRPLEACVGRYGHPATLADADLIVSAINALPQLIAIAEAAEAWRFCDEQPGRCLGNCLHKLADAVDALNSLEGGK